MLACPVCELSSLDGTERCACGFDFTTRSPQVAIARLAREARRGNGQWRRGLVALFFLPVTIALGSPVGLLLGATQLGLAALWIVQGLVRADVANRKLAAAKQLAQLPAARVVQRS